MLGFELQLLSDSLPSLLFAGDRDDLDLDVLVESVVLGDDLVEVDALQVLPVDAQAQLTLGRWRGRDRRPGSALPEEPEAGALVGSVTGALVGSGAGALVGSGAEALVGSAATGFAVAAWAGCGAGVAAGPQAAINMDSTSSNTSVVEATR